MGFYDKGLNTGLISAANQAQSQAGKFQLQSADYLKNIGDRLVDYEDRAWQDETRSRQRKLWEQEDKDKALNEAFRQGLTGPKQIQSGVITDQYLANPTLQQMELTPEELVDYKAYKNRGETGVLSPIIANKLKAQEDFSTGVVKMASDPAFQETQLEQAQRVASQLDGGTKHIYDRLKSIEAADLTARKEKKDKVAKLGKTKSELEEEKNKLRVALQKATVAKNKARSGGKSTGGTTGESSGSKFDGLSNADMLASVKKFGFSEDGRWFSVFANDSEAKEAANQLDRQGVLTLLNMSGLNDKGKKKALEDALAKAQIKGRRGWFSSDAEFDDLRKDVQSTIVEMVNDKEYSAKLDPLEQEYTNQIAQLNQRIRGLDNEIDNQSLDRGELLGKGMDLKSSDWLGQLIGKKEMSGPTVQTTTDSTGTSNVKGTLFDGKNVVRDTSMSLTEQWNNPGAIKYADPKDKSKRWQGQIGVDNQGHAIFDTKENGVRAQLINMNNQIKRGTNLEDYVRKYAHGNQDAYIKYITKQTGIKPDDKLNKEDILKLAEAQTKFEGGEFDKDLLNKGYELAFGKQTNVDEVKETELQNNNIVPDMSTKQAPDIANIPEHEKEIKSGFRQIGEGIVNIGSEVKEMTFNRIKDYFEDKDSSKAKAVGALVNNAAASALQIAGSPYSVTKMFTNWLLSGEAKDDSVFTKHAENARNSAVQLLSEAGITNPDHQQIAVIGSELLIPGSALTKAFGKNPKVVKEITKQLVSKYGKNLKGLLKHKQEEQIKQILIPKTSSYVNRTFTASGKEVPKVTRIEQPRGLY